MQHKVYIQDPPAPNFSVTDICSWSLSERR